MAPLDPEDAVTSRAMRVFQRHVATLEARGEPAPLGAEPPGG